MTRPRSVVSDGAFRKSFRGLAGGECGPDRHCYAVMEDPNLGRNVEPARAMLYLLSGSWTLRILLALSHGPRRRQELVDELGMAPGPANESFRRLEEVGWIRLTKIETGRLPARSDYELIAHVQDLLPTVQLLVDWYDANPTLRPPLRRSHFRESQ